MDNTNLRSATGIKWQLIYPTHISGVLIIPPVELITTCLPWSLFPTWQQLGGMHMLIVPSFMHMRAVGSLMAGSGLEDILTSTFAGVPKMLSGKKYPQNMRALRIVVERSYYALYYLPRR